MSSTLTDGAGGFRVSFGMVVWLSLVIVAVDILHLPHNKAFGTLEKVCRQGKVVDARRPPRNRKVGKRWRVDVRGSRFLNFNPASGLIPRASSRQRQEVGGGRKG